MTVSGKELIAHFYSAASLKYHAPETYLFVCVEVLWPCQQLRSCEAGQLSINTVPGQA